MLTDTQARSVQDYFRTVGERRLDERVSDAAVRQAIGVVWGAIIADVAQHGRKLHGLPKQGFEQELGHVT